MSAERVAGQGMVIEKPVFFPPIPDDGYEVMAQAVAVLGDDGYPVGLQPISHDDIIFNDRKTHMPHANIGHRMAQLARYDSTWFEPFCAADFSQFLVHGPVFPDNDQVEALQWHPAVHLNSAVESGDPRAVVAYQEALSKGKVSGVEGKIDMEGLLIRCFATAMERRKLAGVGLRPELVPITHGDLRAYKALGPKPPLVEVGVLQSLVSDFYAHVEQMFPEITRFRQRQA